MAIAENKQNFEPIRAKLSVCRVVSEDAGCYSNFIGRPRMRAAFASMISYTCFADNLRVDPEQLCVSSGCGSAIQNLVFCLCDDGDGIILPTPTYAALYNDIGTLARGHILDCPTEGDDFRLTYAALSAAYDRGVASGARCSVA
jgi:aspartate/methionine/tyrosine aminotransferase